MDRAVVEKLVSCEIAKALLDCARISKTLDERESRLPIVVFGEDSNRDTIRVQREKLAAVVTELQSNALVEKVLRIAEERWPSCRT